MSFQLMFYPLLPVFLTINIIYGAPKLGGILFEPLLYEAFELQGNTSSPVANKTSNSSSGINEPVNSVGILKMNITNITITDPKETVPPTESTNRTIFISKIRVQTDNSTTKATNDNVARTIPHNETLRVNVTNTPTILQDARKNADDALGIKKMSLYKRLTEEVRRSYLPQNLKGKDIVNQTDTKNSFGYNFDDTICRLVDDRVLCGYNVNPDPPKAAVPVELANGCRQRGDRIECGYINPPFANNLRKFPDSKTHNPDNKPAFAQVLSLQLSDITPTNTPASSTLVHETPKEPIVTQSNDTIKISITTGPSIGRELDKNTTADSSTIESNIRTTRSDLDTKSSKQQYCVEKGDRIICYEVDIQF